MRVWLTAGAFALAFVSSCVFFATRDSLSDMDQFAGIGSFLLALAALGVTAVAAARRRASPEAGTPPGGGGIRTGRIRAKNVIIGPRSSMTITEDGRRRTGD